ncbi:hypothetical protein SVTN_39410 (plasmid) [Streptomyces vietnamensis]|uniref:Uncharacterized protein n=1 Tax=Streptomyces vietnamensis TaxID=362257 RepID=A0A0B5IIH6_9ACTN|nr:hypothetical protein SVTN_39410 [Streptomyces vietnamensis]
MWEYKDATDARSWHPEDGVEPQVKTWPTYARPMMRVHVGGKWRRGTVPSRQDWADGRVFYQVPYDPGTSSKMARLFKWPQPGLQPIGLPAHAGHGALPAPPAPSRARVQAADG